MTDLELYIHKTILYNKEEVDGSRGVRGGDRDAVNVPIQRCM